MRLSSYSIVLTPLKDGNYILLNGLSGAMDVIGASVGRPIEISLEERRDDPDYDAHVILQMHAETRESFLKSGHLTVLEPDYPGLFIRVPDLVGGHGLNCGCGV